MTSGGDLSEARRGRWAQHRPQEEISAGPAWKGVIRIFVPGLVTGSGPPGRGRAGGGGGSQVDLLRLADGEQRCWATEAKGRADLGQDGFQMIARDGPHRPGAVSRKPASTHAHGPWARGLIPGRVRGSIPGLGLPITMIRENRAGPPDSAMTDHELQAGMTPQGGKSGDGASDRCRDSKGARKYPDRGRPTRHPPPHPR